MFYDLKHVTRTKKQKTSQEKSAMEKTISQHVVCLFYIFFFNFFIFWCTNELYRGSRASVTVLFSHRSMCLPRVAKSRQIFPVLRTGFRQKLPIIQISRDLCGNEPPTSISVLRNTSTDRY